MDAKSRKDVKKFIEKQVFKPAAKVTEGPIIFRCDDVVNFSSIKYLEEIRIFLQKRFGGPSGEQMRFMPAISLFGRRNPRGSVYPDVPFKDKPFSYFMDVDSFFQRLRWPEATIASHGLYHVDHTKLSKDALEMSIVGSCRYLRTRIFVPPFNRYNDAAVKVCDENGLHLVRFEEGWRSLEHETFDPAHKLWYFHHWNYKKLEDFAAKLNIKTAKKKPADASEAEEEDTTEAADPRDKSGWWKKGSYSEYEMTPEEDAKSKDENRTRIIQQTAPARA